MKRTILFMLLLCTISSTAVAQYGTEPPKFAVYVDGAWTNWQEWVFFSGGHVTAYNHKLIQGKADKFYITEGHPQEFVLRVNINNFHIPSRAELHNNEGRIECTGTIEYYITDECPSWSAIVQRYSGAYYNFFRYLSDATYRRKPKKLVSSNCKVRVHFKRAITGHTEYLNIPKKSIILSCYNIWVDGYGLAIDMGTGQEVQFSIFY